MSKIGKALLERRPCVGCGKLVPEVDEYPYSDHARTCKLAQEWLRGSSTVNVVELCHDKGEVDVTIHSYPDTPAGNKQAEDVFASILRDPFGVDDEDIKAYIEDGEYDASEYELRIIHSTPVEKKGEV